MNIKELRKLLREADEIDEKLHKSSLKDPEVYISTLGRVSKEEALQRLNLIESFAIGSFYESE